MREGSVGCRSMAPRGWPPGPAWAVAGASVVVGGEVALRDAEAEAELDACAREEADGKDGERSDALAALDEPVAWFGAGAEEVVPGASDAEGLERGGCTDVGADILRHFYSATQAVAWQMAKCRIVTL